MTHFSESFDSKDKQDQYEPKSLGDSFDHPQSDDEHHFPIDIELLMSLTPPETRPSNEMYDQVAGYFPPGDIVYFLDKINMVFVTWKDGNPIYWVEPVDEATEGRADVHRIINETSNGIITIPLVRAEAHEVVDLIRRSSKRRSPKHSPPTQF